MNRQALDIYSAVHLGVGLLLGITRVVSPRDAFSAAIGFELMENTLGVSFGLTDVESDINYLSDIGVYMLGYGVGAAIRRSRTNE